LIQFLASAVIVGSPKQMSEFNSQVGVSKRHACRKWTQLWTAGGREICCNAILL